MSTNWLIGGINKDLNGFLFGTSLFFVRRLQSKKTLITTSWNIKTSKIMNGITDAYQNAVMFPEEYTLCSSALATIITGELPSGFNTTKDEEYMDIALSILADSTSPGPDSHEMKYLGWNYGNGPGAGSEGNWDSCQTLRHDSQVGKALHQMQEDLLESSNPSSNHVLDASKFCTLGALSPWSVIGDGAQQTWNSPFAGICVPGICSARALYYLFDVTNGYSNTILNLAQNSDQDPLREMNSLRYLTSLTKSFQAAKIFQAGVLCQGETGSAVIDKGYRDFGYYATLAITVVLFVCVCIGTIATSYIKYKKREITHMLPDDCKCDAEPKPLLPIKESSGPSSSQIFIPTNYGSNYDDSHNIDTSNLTPLTQDSSACTYHIEAFEDKEDLFNDVKVQGFIYTCMSCLQYIFGTYFDASQNFYEITRLKVGSAHPKKSNGRISRMGGIDTHDYSNSSLANENGSHKKLENSHHSNNDQNEDDPPTQISQTMTSSKCLDGLRSISMLWIILGHTLSIQASIGYTNPSNFFPPNGMISSYFGSFIMSASYAVDTFFFISGYLAMSGLLKRLDPELKKLNNNDESDYYVGSIFPKSRELLTKIGFLNPFHEDIGNYGRKRLLRNEESPFKFEGMSWVFPYLFHRVLRILPTYGFILLLWWKVTITLGDGPFWPHWATFTQRCDKYAWTNMLFLNNLIPWNQPSGEMSECMFHAWYLGVDFQLYAVLTPIFVALYLHMHRKITILLEFLLVIVIIAMSFFGTFYFNWSAYTSDGMQSVAYDREFYINPFYRSTPYIIGFISAQLWHEKSRVWPNFGITNKLSVFLSISSVLLMAYLPFWSASAYTNRPCLSYEDPLQNPSCGTGLTQYEKAIFNSFMRPLWSLGLVVISMLSFNGQLNFLGAHSVLTWPGWDPIGKLSFSMYLLHPLVGNFLLLGRTSKLRYTNAGFITMYAGISIVTFLLALCIGLLVEWPLSKITRDIEKMIYEKKKDSCSESNVATSNIS